MKRINYQRTSLALTAYEQKLMTMTLLKLSCHSKLILISLLNHKRTHTQIIMGFLSFFFFSIWEFQFNLHKLKLGHWFEMRSFSGLNSGIIPDKRNDYIFQLYYLQPSCSLHCMLTIQNLWNLGKKDVSGMLESLQNMTANATVLIIYKLFH